MPGAPGVRHHSRLTTQCSRMAQTVYRRLRHTNLIGLPSSLARTSAGSPYTLLMLCHPWGY